MIGTKEKMIDTKEVTTEEVTTEELTVPDLKEAKLSDILESYPESGLCKTLIQNKEGQVCAIGLALKMLGIEPAIGFFYPDLHGERAIFQRWGIGYTEMTKVMGLFDTSGRAATVKYLRERDL